MYYLQNNHSFFTFHAPFSTILITCGLQHEPVTRATAWWQDILNCKILDMIWGLKFRCTIQQLWWGWQITLETGTEEINWWVGRYRAQQYPSSGSFLLSLGQDVASLSKEAEIIWHSVNIVKLWSGGLNICEVWTMFSSSWVPTRVLARCKQMWAPTSSRVVNKNHSLGISHGAFTPSVSFLKLEILQDTFIMDFSLDIRFFYPPAHPQLILMYS